MDFRPKRVLKDFRLCPAIASGNRNCRHRLEISVPDFSPRTRSNLTNLSIGNNSAKDVALSSFIDSNIGSPANSLERKVVIMDSSEVIVSNNQIENCRIVVVGRGANDSGVIISGNRTDATPDQK
jgi:hypothetical protein